MIRATNAKFKFKLPYSIDQIEWVRIKFWQPENQSLQPITKTKPDCYGVGQELYVSLTVDETKRFSDRYKAKVQLRAQALDGSIFASKQQLITVYPIQDDMTEDVPVIPPANEEGWIIFDGEAIG